VGVACSEDDQVAVPSALIGLLLWSSGVAMSWAPIGTLALAGAT
jgi:hypothetical protein